MTHFPENEQPIISTHYLTDGTPFAGATTTIICQSSTRSSAELLHSQTPRQPLFKSSLTRFSQHAKTGWEFLSNPQGTKENWGWERQTNLEPPQWVSQIWISVKKPACFRSCTEKILRWKALSLWNITNLGKKITRVRTPHHEEFTANGVINSQVCSQLTGNYL